MGNKISFTEVIKKWNANSRFNKRNSDRTCEFSDDKTNPYWCFIGGWYGAGFSTSFMFNHKDYVIQTVVEEKYGDNEETLAAVALPGKPAEHIGDLYSLFRWIDDNAKGFTSQDQIIFTTRDINCPKEGTVNSTEKLFLYVNTSRVGLYLTITQFSPYRNLVKADAELDENLDMREVLTPFMSDDMFVIELINEAEKHYKKTKQTLVGFLREEKE